MEWDVYLAFWNKKRLALFWTGTFPQRNPFRKSLWRDVRSPCFSPKFCDWCQESYNYSGHLPNLSNASWLWESFKQKRLRHSEQEEYFEWIKIFILNSLDFLQPILQTITLWKSSWDSIFIFKHLWKPRTKLCQFWLRTVTLHPPRTEIMMTNIISSRTGNQVTNNVKTKLYYQDSIDYVLLLLLLLLLLVGSSWL